MIKFLKNLSLMPKGLKYKTMIAFSLMSLIPLLICVWLVTTYLFPNIGLISGLSLGNISLILTICIGLSLLGLFITREMIDPVVKMAEDARGIARGDLDKVIDITREDEIGDLSASLSFMTKKIKENMDELKIYGERTKMINLEINKKVLALSSLLQIGNLISSSADLPSVLDFICQKVSDVEDNAVAFIMMLEEAKQEFEAVSICNIDENKLEVLKIRKGELTSNIIIDRKNPAETGVLNKIIAVLDLKNIAAMPIIVSGKQCGILAIANRKGSFEFKEDEKELLKIFVKQTSIAIENDLLVRKARELAIKDELTGLYNKNYMQTRLDEEIKRACIYQRPCGYLFIDVDNFKDFHEKFGEVKTQIFLRTLAEILKKAVTEVDKVARLGEDKFAVILPERNKKQAANIAEGIRKKVEGEISAVIKTAEKITVSIGVSENPIDGSTADELMEKAERLARDAKSLGKNRVAV